MPTPPRYNQRVKQAPLPTVRTSPDASAEAFGGGESARRLSTATRGLGEEALKIGLYERERADNLSFQSNDMSLSELQTQIEVESKKMQGKNAAGAIDYANKTWQDGYKEIEKNIPNDRVKAMVGKSAMTRYESLNKSVQLHMANEFNKYDTAQTEAYIANARIEGGTHYKEPDRIAQSLIQQEGAIQKQAVRMGWDEEITKKKIFDATSKTHADVLSNMLLNGESKMAQEYHEKYQSSMTAASSKTLGESIKKAVLRDDSLKMANEIVTEHSNAVDAMKAVEAIQDPELKERVRKDVNTQFKVQENLKKKEAEQIKQAYGQNVFKSAELLNKGQLTPDYIQNQVITNQMTPDDANVFKIAMASPKEWKSWSEETSSSGAAVNQAQGGMFFVEAIGALDKGDDISKIITTAVSQYNDGKIDNVDLAWVLHAAEMRNQPEQKGMWDRFVSTVRSAVKNLGYGGAMEYMKSWDFKTDPHDHYKQAIDTALSGAVGINSAPKYLVNAFGFMRQLFDGEQSGEKKPAAAAGGESASKKPSQTGEAF